MNIMELIREKQDKLLNKDNRFDSKSVVSSVDLWLSQFENTNTKTLPCSILFSGCRLSRSKKHVIIKNFDNEKINELLLSSFPVITGVFYLPIFPA